MDDLFLEVGKTYETRQGNKNTITSKLDEDTQMHKMGYRFVGGPCGQYYTGQGRSYTDGSEASSDLVREYF